MYSKYFCLSTYCSFSMSRPSGKLTNGNEFLAIYTWTWMGSCSWTVFWNHFDSILFVKGCLLILAPNTVNWSKKPPLQYYIDTYLLNHYFIYILNFSFLWIYYANEICLIAVCLWWGERGSMFLQWMVLTLVIVSVVCCKFCCINSIKAIVLILLTAFI